MQNLIQKQTQIILLYTFSNFQCSKKPSQIKKNIIGAISLPMICKILTKYMFCTTGLIKSAIWSKVIAIIAIILRSNFQSIFTPLSKLYVIFTDRFYYPCIFMSTFSFHTSQLCLLLFANSIRLNHFLQCFIVCELI